MLTRYLCLYEEGKHKSLHFLNQPVPDPAGPSRYRISPIFPAVKEDVTFPDFKANTYVGFFFYQPAFPALGHLLNKFPPEKQRLFWFNHGLSSILVFSMELDFLKEVSATYKKGLRAFEYWTLKDNLVIQNDFWLCKPTPYDPSIFNIKDYSSLDVDLHRLLDELQNSLNTAISMSAQYIPSQLLNYQKLVEAVNEIVEELIFLFYPERTPPVSITGIAAETIRGNPLEKQKMINQRTSLLVQINSVLSYVISQAFSGIIPIIENDCHVRSFSLLGVGTAFCALAAFAGFIERVFKNYPVDEVVASKYSQIRGPRNLFKNIQNINPSEWSNYSVDTFLGTIQPKPRMPKLVCYSGRQGFRETEYAVYGALPVLYSADMPCWSLLTVTHELMHAQVRAILSVLFPHQEGCSPDQTWQEYRKRFIEVFFYGNPEEDSSNLLESIRNIILNYSRFAQNLKPFLESSERCLAEFDQIIPSADKLRRDFLEEHNFINEIMVHILDYNYFYNCNNRLYLGLLWESWATVPVVLDLVERYVFRSILVVSSKQAGTVEERFDISCSIVHEELTLLLKKNLVNILIQEALKCLGDTRIRNKLRILSNLGIYIVEMTQKFLISSHIQAALLRKDKNLDVDPDGEGYPFRYLLSAGDFPELRVESPVALIADRLKRALNRDKSRGPEADFYSSAWVLLACASALE